MDGKAAEYDHTLRSTVLCFWNSSTEFLLSQWLLCQFVSHTKESISLLFISSFFSFNPSFSKLLLRVRNALCAVLVTAEKMQQDTGSVLKDPLSVPSTLVEYQGKPGFCGSSPLLIPYAIELSFKRSQMLCKLGVHHLENMILARFVEVALCLVRFRLLHMQGPQI